MALSIKAAPVTLQTATDNSGAVPQLDLDALDSGSGRDLEINAGSDLILKLNQSNLAVDVGDPGSESAGINVGGTTYNSGLRVHDIGGSRVAQFHLHRHSTSNASIIIGSRSNSNTNSHSDVTNDMPLLGIVGSGWAGSNYKEFAQILLDADDSGTISNTSAPGRIRFRVTPDGSTSPTDCLSLSNDCSSNFTGNVTIANTGPQLTLEDTDGSIWSVSVDGDELNLMPNSLSLSSILNFDALVDFLPSLTSVGSTANLINFAPASTVTLSSTASILKINPTIEFGLFGSLTGVDAQGTYRPGATTVLQTFQLFYGRPTLKSTNAAKSPPSASIFLSNPTYQADGVTPTAVGFHKTLLSQPNLNSTSGKTITITELTCIEDNLAAGGAGSKAITSRRGHWFKDAPNSISTTTQVALEIDDIDQATNNYGIRSQMSTDFFISHEGAAESRFDGRMDFRARVAHRDSSPAQITSDQNNYDPGSTSTVRLSTDASRTVTGIVAGSQADFLWVINVGSNDLVLAHQSGSSTAANRIISNTGANLTLNATEAALIWYDSTDSRWRVLSTTGA